MNILEREMIDILLELKEKYSVFEIKAEYESEGSRIDEMMRLKDVTSNVNLPIILKIGGVEALTDVYSGLQLGIKGIVAPMAETRFALSKFLNIIKNMIAKDNAEMIEFSFNMETITCFNNLNDMLESPDIGFLNGMTVGRVDLTASMGLERSMVDSEQIYEICRKAFTMAREKGLKTALGGAISDQSIDFITRLNREGLLDKFETRKVVFRADAIRYGSDAINKAVEFELKWLISKRRYYSGIKSEDEKRIQMLEKRANKTKSIID